MTAGAKKTWELECDIPLEDLISLADVVHEDKNLRLPYPAVLM